MREVIISSCYWINNYINNNILLDFLNTVNAKCEIAKLGVKSGVGKLQRFGQIEVSDYMRGACHKNQGAMPITADKIRFPPVLESVSSSCTTRDRPIMDMGPIRDTRFLLSERVKVVLSDPALSSPMSPTCFLPPA